MGDPHAAKAIVPEPPAAGLWLGLDTGGTYTDAVLLADGRQVVASAKSLTTHWDLAVGIGDARERVRVVRTQGLLPSD
jgi:N-methylhydantoinase A/oxoprolinase/acetone carboxylase beta subunit